MAGPSNYKFYFIDTLFFIIPALSLMLSYPFGIGSIILFFMKWKSEGFRYNIYLQLFCSALCMMPYRECYLAAICFYSIGMHYFSRYEIPGNPVGYQREKLVLKDNRELDLFIYYPAQNGKEKEVKQIPITDQKLRTWKNILVHQKVGQKPFSKWKADLMFGCLEKEKQLVILEGELKGNEKKHVVVFCPGTSMHPNLYSSIIRGLVEENSVVFALDHTKYDDICPSNRETQAFREQRENEINRRSDEVVQLVSQIQNGNFAKLFQQKVNTSQIFLCGHSYGGSTAISTALRIKFAGIMLLDPWTWPVPRNDLQQFSKKKQPVLIWRSLSFSNMRKLVFNENQFEEINLIVRSNDQALCGFMPDSDHMTMCDLPFIFPREYLKAKVISNTKYLKELTKNYNKAMNIFIKQVKLKQFSKDLFVEEYSQYEKASSGVQIAIWNQIEDSNKQELNSK